MKGGVIMNDLHCPRYPLTESCGPGGPNEEERGVFERGGWADFDDEAGTVTDEIYQRAEAFHLGRRTYEIFAGSWGTWADPGGSPIWTALNTKPKYVPSTTLRDPRWHYRPRR
jgi:hypothetical protein